MARDIEGLSIIETAKKLKRDPGGLSRLANKLDKKCNTSPLIKEEILSLKNELFNCEVSTNT